MSHKPGFLRLDHILMLTLLIPNNNYYIHPITIIYKLDQKMESALRGHATNSKTRGFTYKMISMFLLIRTFHSTNCKTW